MWVSFDDCEIRNKGDLNNRNILLNIDKVIVFAEMLLLLVTLFIFVEVFLDF